MSQTTLESMPTRHLPPPIPEGYEHVRSIKIQRPQEEVYQFFRELENLPRFMIHLKEVREIDARRSHWIASGPNDKSYEWDAVITDEQPNQSLSWQSEPGADVTNRGRVDFFPATGNRGTVVRVAIDYKLPGGPIGKAAAAIAGKSPEQEVADDLRRLRAVLEAGESAEVLGQTRGERSLLGKIVSHNT